MSSELHDFERFMKERESAARAYANGDAEPVSRLSTRTSPATFFHPNGDCEQGAQQVVDRYERDAQSFDTGSDTNFEILQMAASGGLAYWVGLQHATVRFKGNPEAIPMTLRITELYRREGDAWKLIHRHADPLQPKSGDR